MRIPIVLAAAGALMLQGCAVAAATGAAVGTVAGAAVGGAVKVTAKGVGAAGKAVTGHHKKGKDREPPPEPDSQQEGPSR